MHSSSFLFIWVNLLFLLRLSFPSFSHPFSPANNVSLYGDAYIKDNTISLTQEHTCLSSYAPSPSSSGSGRAFFIYPVRFLDLSTNSAASFSCHFSFIITPSPYCSAGDGFTFLITSNANSFSLSDGYMGLPEPGLNSQASFIAVEFDTSYDQSLGDINGNHIGIDVNTVVSFAQVDALSKGVDLKSGKHITAWIEYRDSAKLIQVWIGYTRVRPRKPILVAEVDLSKQFKEYMHVGFSASNGQGSAIHLVNRWKFKTFGFFRSAIPLDSIEEGDCIICSTGNSSTNNGNDDVHKQKSRIGDMGLGLWGVAALSFCTIGSLGFICFFLIKRKKSCDRRSNGGQTSKVHFSRIPTRLSLSEIKLATMGFHRNRILGEGASAKVYKGSLPSGRSVAVKRFSQVDQIESMHNPFDIEFATMAGCLRHKNLVQLQGWCCEGNELALVYEYLPNGSLDKILYKNTNSITLFSWKRRLNVVLGVASALTYLHEECERQIIHRDVKSCNIMLDEEFNAKLGDFGLAEVYERNSMTRAATIPAGTMGYLAPEYVYSGVPTEKTDVYSFGVVVLEVATGRRPVEGDGTVLVDWVWDLWAKGKLAKAVDTRLMGKFDVEMERMLKVGLCCVHPNHEKRPTVREAARILRGESPIPLLPARKPTLKIRSILPESSEDMLNCAGDSSPGLDDAPWMTPKSHFSKF